MTRVAVLGGGSWGTALAQAMRQGDHEVVLWARDRGLIDAGVRPDAVVIQV